MNNMSSSVTFRRLMRIFLLGLLLLLQERGHRAAAEQSKDGFNLYKDYLLRGKNSDSPGMSLIHAEDLGWSPKVLYFYRTASGALPSIVGLPEENKKGLHYGKRTSNQFKNYMLTREPPELQFPIAMGLEGAKGEMIDQGGRPIPVRSSILVSKQGPEETLSNKRAIFSWSAIREPTRLTADLSDYYSATAPPGSVISLSERLNKNN